jgi:hypothetical protein
MTADDKGRFGATDKVPFLWHMLWRHFCSTNTLLNKLENIWRCSTKIDAEIVQLAAQETRNLKGCRPAFIGYSAF